MIGSDHSNRHRLRHFLTCEETFMLINRCGQARAPAWPRLFRPGGDLPDVGLHQPCQLAQLGNIKEDTNFLVIYTVYCQFDISTLLFQVHPDTQDKAAKAKKAFSLTFRGLCGHLSNLTALHSLHKCMSITFPSQNYTFVV